MNDETGVWLSPMLDEANLRADIDVQALMRQASMPAAEADTPTLDWLAANPVPGVRHMAFDWIRFGQLLREQLGWGDYPLVPSVEQP